MKIDDYVMDFLVLDDKVQVIEVNCYGSINLTFHNTLFIFSMFFQ